MDRGHIDADRNLRRLESKLKKEYKRAYVGMKEKTDKYFAKFEKLDKEKLELVKAGKLTEKDYLLWRQNKFLVGEHYEKFAYDLSRDLTHTNVIAAGMIKESTIGAYQLNYNYAAYEICKGTGANIAFDLVDHATVERIINKNPQLLPLPRKGTKSYERWIDRDTRWNYRKVRSAFTQSLLQGESIPHMAKRLQTVTDMSNSAAVRNARTMTTAAESAGRIDRYHEAQDMGIEMQKTWVATLDDRTRDAHIELDGVTIDVDEDFVNSIGKIAYPADPHADPENTYNCRCTLISSIKGFAHDFSGRVLSDKLGDMTYDEWKASASK